MMKLLTLTLLLAVIFSLAGNTRCIAETVRSRGKPALQTLSLTVIPVNDSDTTYSGVFLAPTDTQFEYDGTIMDVTKGESSMVTAILSNNNDNFRRWLVMKSESKSETVKLFLNYNFNIRTQTTFVLNSCDVGIEKTQKESRTEYKTTLENCAGGETLSKYFIAFIRDKSGKLVQLSSRDLSTPDNGRIMEYYKYVDTYYTSIENDIYYAILNYPAMENDGVVLESFGFVLYVSEGYDLKGDDIAVSQIWYYDINSQ